MSKFKVGDRVRSKSTGCKYTLRSRNYSMDGTFGDAWNTDGLGWLGEKQFELIKERTMKDYVSIRDLLEDRACQDGILRFIDYVLKDEDTSIITKSFSVRDTFITAEANGFNDDVDWLKSKGYNYQNKKLEKLRKKVQELNEEIEKLENA
jgi:hypothetical protein